MRYFSSLNLLASGIGLGVLAGAFTVLGLFGLHDDAGVAAVLALAGICGFLGTFALLIGLIAAGVEVGVRSARRP